MLISNKVVRLFTVSLFLIVNFIVATAALAEDEIIMGVFPRRNAETTMKMYAPLAEYLSLKLGKKVQIETEKTFPRFWEKVLKGRYDIVHYNQLHYLLSQKSVGYEVFAKSEELGYSTVAPAIVVRKDSGINSLEDLRGKNIMFGGSKLAMISFVANKVILAEKGLNENDYASMLAINPPNATFSVFHKKADAAAVGDIALDIGIVKSKINVDELKYLYIGTPQPHFPWVYKVEMDAKIKEIIQREMISLSNSPQGNDVLKSIAVTNILSANDEEYDVSRNVYREFKKLSNK